MEFPNGTFALLTSRLSKFVGLITSKQRYCLVSVVTLLFIGVALWLRWAPINTVQKIDRTILLSYQFELTNPTSQLIQGAEFEVFAPMRETPVHSFVSATSNLPYALQTDSYGQQTFVFSSLQLAPFATLVINIRAEVGIKAPGFRVWPESITEAAFLEQKTFTPTDGVVKVASQLKDASVDAKVASAFDWVSKNIQSVEYIAEDRGVDYALKYRRGDCTEIMQLYGALVRAQGVPALDVAGFTVDPAGAVLRADAYHNWNEVEVNQEWLLVDAQRKHYGKTAQHYIAFRLFGLSDGERLANSSQRFVIHDGRLTAKMI